MPLQLWPDPLDGLDPTDPLTGLDQADAPWNWLEVDSSHDGPTDNPPTPHPGWERWYFRYEKPDGTKVKVTNIENGKSVVVTINDRMNKSNPAVIDLTRHAAEELGFGKTGKTKVKLEVEK